MKWTKKCSMTFVLTIFVIGLTAASSYGGSYEVWQCGQCNEFNCQGFSFTPSGTRLMIITESIWMRRRSWQSTPLQAEATIAT